MKSNRKWLFFLFLSLALYIAAYRISIALKHVGPQTLADTTELSATGENVIFSKESISEICIVTEEYGGALHMAGAVAEKMAIEDIAGLQKGESIIFRVENSELQRFAEENYAEMVTLETSEREILTLVQYNQYLHERVRIPRMLCVFCSIVSIPAAFYCVLRYKGIDIFRKLRKRKSDRF